MKTQQIHNHNTRGAQRKHLYLPQIKTTLYGTNSIIYQSITAWNNIHKKINKNINDVSRNQFYKAIKEHLQKAYYNDD